MQGHQVFEFFALDRPLTARDIVDLRAVARGAEITQSHMRVESRLAGLGIEASKLLVRYFDAMLSNDGRGVGRLMFRLPLARICPTQLEAYFPAGPARASRTRDHLVLDISYQAAQDDVGNREALSLLLPLRTALLEGDLRVAYLAWLLSVQADEVNAHAEEPPVPPGLASLTEPLEALVRLLRLDAELVCAAAERDTPSTPKPPTLGGWVAGLPSSEKNRWLMRALDGREAAVGSELISAYRTATQTGSPRRTVLELRERVDARRAECARVGRAACPCSARAAEGHTDSGLQHS